MTDEQTDPLRAKLERYIGKPLGSTTPTEAPDKVNLPMIRHWVDALDDRNPIYLDSEAAATTRYGEIVAPPAMLQTWTMPRPVIEGIAERGGAPNTSTENAIGALDKAGYSGSLATNSELEFERYLKVGEQLHSMIMLESISEQKSTAFGLGYFVTWVTTYTNDQDEVVGRQMFRVLKFKPANPKDNS